MGKRTNHESDMEFLSQDLPKAKVAREVALKDFKRFLVDRNLLKKALRKADANDENRDNFESAKEIIIDCIMDGSVVVTEDAPCKLVHNLNKPPADSNGSPLYETLEYGFIPNLASLRKLDSFDDNESMGKTQALLSAMTNKAVKELGKISSTDLDVIAAVAFFFC